MDRSYKTLILILYIFLFFFLTNFRYTKDKRQQNYETGSCYLSSVVKNLDRVTDIGGMVLKIIRNILLTEKEKRICKKYYSVFSLILRTESLNFSNQRIFYIKF